MRIALLCATQRGRLILQKLFEWLPQSKIVVFSFREEPWEPPFFDDIREVALGKGGQFVEARHVGHSRLESFWESTTIDLMLVVSWRYLIPRSIYRRPRLGAFVFHDSLLPEYRGFSPTVWAIINGADHTGATLFEIAEEVDAGDIIAQERIPIGHDETICEVMAHVTESYLQLLEKHLDQLLSGNAKRYPQNHRLATYTCKRVPDDNLIDWTAPAEKVFNLIRAVSSPYPGAHTSLGGRPIRIWSARRVSDESCFAGSIPGRVVEVRPGEGSVVLAGNQRLLLTRVQPDGREVVCAADVLNSLSMTLGR